MFLIRQASRIAAALRSAEPTTPMDRLAEMLRRGDDTGTPFLQLCLDLGLVARATAALQGRDLNLSRSRCGSATPC